MSRSRLLAQSAIVLSASALGLGVAFGATHLNGAAPETTLAAKAQSATNTNVVIRNVSSSAVSSAAAISVTDDAGRTIQLTEPATRVAVINPFAVQVLDALGVIPVVRPELPADVSPEMMNVPVIPVSHSAGPSLETIVAARPDLIISSPVYESFSRRLSQATGAPVLSVEITDTESFVRRVNDLGSLLDRTEQADSYAESIQRLTTPDDSSSIANRPRVFALFGAPGSFYAFHQDSFLGSLVVVAGGDMLSTGTQDQRYAQLTSFSMESVVAMDPDVILVVSHLGGERQVRQLMADPAWSGLRAVRAGMVQSISEERTIIAPGMDLVRTLDDVRDAIHGGLAGQN